MFVFFADEKRHGKHQMRAVDDADQSNLMRIPI